MSTTQVHVKQEFYRFAENISVKGVSRILKTKNKIYRALWSVAVVTSLCILLWQLTTVFIKYFSWPVETHIEESLDQPSFPDVTFCNLYPTYNLESMSEKISWLAYSNALLVTKTMKISTFEKFNNLSEEDYVNMLVYINSRTGYFSNFPIVEENIAVDDQMIKTFRAYDWQLKEYKFETCQPILRYHWDPYYSTCYTMSISDECQGLIRGMTLILYIHNFPEAFQLGYRPSFAGSQANGVIVAFQPPGTYPNVKMGHLVGPGTDSNMRLSPAIRTLLPSPYSDCTNQIYIESKTDMTGKKLIYTEDVCIDVCLQQQVLDKCGCLSIGFGFTPEQKYQANGIVCGNLSLLENTSLSSIKKGMNDYLCSTTNLLDGNRCEVECLTQCLELSYDLTISSAPWPHASTQPLFAEAMDVFSSDYQSKFDIYGNMINELKNGTSSPEIFSQIEQAGLIEKNFLQLNIFFERYRTLILKDVPSMTAEKLLGIIGGGLSLWLGITIMTLVEVLEFILTLVHMYIKKTKKFVPPASGIDAKVGDVKTVNRISVAEKF